MKEFVTGTDRQYKILRDSLEDHLCHVYGNSTYPPGCSRGSGRLGFEKEGETYALFIDRGMTCSNPAAPELFREWLSSGTLRFLDFTDMTQFLRSLKCLYEERRSEPHA